jgi:hypothetical protein
MNNFVFNTDPLLYSASMPHNKEFVPEQDIKRQLDYVISQYQQYQQQNKQPEQPSNVDWLGDYDRMLKSLDEDVAIQISEDQEFNKLNEIVQQDIQNEIMLSIKWKLNSRNDTVQRIKRMMEIIDYYNKNKANEDKKNMAEISDYLQNYSDMTFNEYKQMKSAK